jgi:hypothetical protein
MHQDWPSQEWENTGLKTTSEIKMEPLKYSGSYMFLGFLIFLLTHKREKK